MICENCLKEKEPLYKINFNQILCEECLIKNFKIGEFDTLKELRKDLEHCKITKDGEYV